MIEDVEGARGEPLYLVSDLSPARRRRIVAWYMAGDHLEPMVVERGIVKVPDTRDLANSCIVGPGEVVCTCDDANVEPGEDPGWCEKCPGEIRR